MTIEQFRNKAAEELNRTVEGLKAMLEMELAEAKEKAAIAA